MTSADDRGRFVWYDLMTPDPAAARAFYGSITGWGTQLWEGGDKPYQMWTNGEAPLGGIMEIAGELERQGVPPNWMAYVAVPDVAAAAQHAADLGGHVEHPPTEIPGVGHFAVISDPQGAVIAIYSSANQHPPVRPPQVGEFSWHELASADWEAGFAFYSELFGWEKLEAMDMGPAGTYQIYGRGGISLGGMFTKPPALPVSCWLYYVSVADLDAAIGAVKAGGGEVVNGPMDVPGGDRIAQCTDPHGAMFALHESKACS